MAATHYVLGEALDRDPFLLFELRGRTKTRVLDALRLARGGAATPASGAHASEADARSEEHAETSEPASVPFGKFAAADYDRARAPLPVLDFSFAEPLRHGAVLRQLGVPVAWSGTDAPVDALSPLVRRAAAAARRIALAEPELSAVEAGPTSAAQNDPSAQPAAHGRRAAKAKSRSDAKPTAKATARTDTRAKAKARRVGKPAVD